MKNLTLPAALLFAFSCVPAVATDTQEKPQRACKNPIVVGGRIVKLGATALAAYACLNTANTFLCYGGRGLIDQATGDTFTRCEIFSPFRFACVDVVYGKNSRRPIDENSLNITCGLVTGCVGAAAAISCKNQIKNLH